MENIARYIIRAFFSQERMYYIPDESKIVYESKDGKEEKVFDALEWIAAMYSHVPNKCKQMVRYVGFYSNVSRGKRKNHDQDDLIPSILEPEGSSREYRKNWARLIQKIYEVDPLTCPKCQGRMRILAFIEDEEVIKKILKHLGPWERKARPPPNTAVRLQTSEYSIDHSTSQIPPSKEWLYRDPVYPETFPSCFFGQVRFEGILFPNFLLFPPLRHHQPAQHAFHLNDLVGSRPPSQALRSQPQHPDPVVAFSLTPKAI